MKTIALNNKNYTASVTKHTNPNNLKLVITNNHLNILEQKISKQEVILNDPFHWSKNTNKKTVNDLVFLKTLSDGLKHSLGCLNTNYDLLTLKDELQSNPYHLQVTQQLKQIKDLILMTDNYLNLRSKKNQEK